ncbi:hypothetical protein SDC9_103183 [bioreactor metagenome]|uniref:Uncharacterized protein n=1 Tax=bioreactor metagenome TaxID=1076179 RepID=A0A645AVP3_9ZZZZ
MSRALDGRKLFGWFERRQLTLAEHVEKRHDDQREQFRYRNARHRAHCAVLQPFRHPQMRQIKADGEFASLLGKLAHSCAHHLLQSLQVPAESAHDGDDQKRRRHHAVRHGRAFTDGGSRQKIRP